MKVLHGRDPRNCTLAPVRPIAQDRPDYQEDPMTNETAREMTTQTTDQDLIDLVTRYFAAVDAGNLDGVLKTLAIDCKFAVETHGIELNGHHELRGMYERLWSNHAAMVHDQMRFVPDAGQSRIAAQFRVVNTEFDGSTTIKSNCNFFTAQYGRFSEVQVYMAGETTLDRAGA